MIVVTRQDDEEPDINGYALFCLSVGGALIMCDTKCSLTSTAGFIWSALVLLTAHDVKAIISYWEQVK